VKCSVIVPVYNDWHRVPYLLECLERQTFKHENFEVILVDNASDRFSPPDSMPPNARIEHCRARGSYAARNEGIKHAAGNWLVFTDADCRPRPDWLENLMTVAEQSTARPANQPSSEPANQQTLLAGAVHMVSDSQTPNLYEIYDLVRGIPQDWYVKRGYAATANLALPAELMARLGGFDAGRISGGDAELCGRARQAGARLRYVPDAVVEHPARSSWRELRAKVRRIKAGQIAAGDWKRRFRSLLPPVIEIWRCLRVTGRPFKHRLTAMMVQFALWPVELRAALRAGRANPLRYNSDIDQ
jgi:GT2 family glycosyltransferase